MQIPQKTDGVPTTFSKDDARRVTHDVATEPPPPSDDDEPPVESQPSPQRDALQALIDGKDGPEDAPTGASKSDRPNPQDHVITEADLGRTLGDVAYELAMGNLPPMSESQQRLLTELLFDKGYAEREFTLPMGFTLVFRSGTTALATAVKARLRKELREAGDQSHAADTGPEDPKARGRRRSAEPLSNPEFMLLTNRIAVASQLVRFNQEPTCDEQLDFASDEALSQRIDFVLTGAYDGVGVQAVLLDHMAVLLNGFNDEVNQLVAGKYLSRF